jgi:mRNA interferase RelE/StbE
MALYAVSFRRSAEKDLRRLDAATQQRVLRVTTSLARVPRPAGCRKLHGSDNAFRIRVGDYRIVYTVDDEVLVVAIERVRHRREVYR